MQVSPVKVALKRHALLSIAPRAAHAAPSALRSEASDVADLGQDCAELASSRPVADQLSQKATCQISRAGLRKKKKAERFMTVADSVCFLDVKRVLGFNL